MEISAYLQSFVAGVALTVSLIMAIGAQNAFVLRQGLRREHVRWVVLVCAGLDIVLMTIGVSGVALAIGRNETALRAVALCGAAYLFWFGVGAARRALHAESMTAQVDGQKTPVAAVVRQTVAVTLLNPHVYLDTVLLVGAVGAQRAPELRPAFLVGAGSASAVWFAALGFGAALLAPVFARPMAWRVLDGLVALMMFGVGASLLVTLH